VWYYSKRHSVGRKQEPNSVLGTGGGVWVKHFYRGDKNKRNELGFGHDGLKSGKLLMGVKSPTPYTATPVPYTRTHWLAGHHSRSYVYTFYAYYIMYTCGQTPFFLPTLMETVKWLSIPQYTFAANAPDVSIFPIISSSLRSLATYVSFSLILIANFFMLSVITFTGSHILHLCIQLHRLYLAGTNTATNTINERFH